MVKTYFGITCLDLDLNYLFIHPSIFYWATIAPLAQFLPQNAAVKKIDKDPELLAINSKEKDGQETDNTDTYVSDSKKYNVEK